MAQPAVLFGEDRTNFIGVPAFRPKSTTEPLFPWESWIGQFFLAVNLKEYCNANILLSDPVKVFDDPPPRPERKGETESQPEEANHIATDKAEVRKPSEINERRRKKRPKISPNVFFFMRRTKGSNRDYSSLRDQNVRKHS